MSSCIRIYESDGEDESRPTEPAESVERPTEPESVEQMPSCFASSCYNVFSTKDTDDAVAPALSSPDAPGDDDAAPDASPFERIISQFSSSVVDTFSIDLRLLGEEARSSSHAVSGSISREHLRSVFSRYRPCPLRTRSHQRRSET